MAAKLLNCHTPRSEQHPELIDIFEFGLTGPTGIGSLDTCEFWMDSLKSADFLYQSLKTYVSAYTSTKNQYISIQEARVDKLLDNFFNVVCEESSKDTKNILISPENVRNCRFDMLSIFLGGLRCTAENCLVHLLPPQENHVTVHKNVAYGIDHEEFDSEFQSSFHFGPKKTFFRECSHTECLEKKCRYNDKINPPTLETFHSYAFKEVFDGSGNLLNREYFKTWKENVHNEYLESKQQAGENYLKKLEKFDDERSVNLKQIAELKLKMKNHSEVVAWNRRYQKEIKENEDKIKMFLAKQFEWNRKVQDLELELETTRLEVEFVGTSDASIRRVIFRN